MHATRTILSIAGGIIAGIAGLTGWWGFLVFGLVSLIISGLQTFRDHGTSSNEGLSQALMSFVLFWTLFYGIVHIF